MNRFRNACALGALLVASTAFAQNQSNITYACDRACLTKVIDAYVAGLIASDPARVPFAPGAKLALDRHRHGSFSSS